MMEVMKIMGTSFKRSHAHTATLSTPNPAAGHLQPTPLPEIPGHSWASLGQSLVGHFFLPGPGVHKVLFMPSKSLFPHSCVTSGSSMVGLMATSSKKAYAISRSAAPRAPAPVAGHSWPAPLQEFCLSLCGVSGSWGAQGLFEPSEHLWPLWDLVVNVILPLLPSCWGFSFALGCGVSPQSHSSPAQPLLQHLQSCWGFSAFGCGVPDDLTCLLRKL